MSFDCQADLESAPKLIPCLFGRARELIAAFGIGLIARTVFQELSELGGVPGWILSAGIASATVAIGYGVMAWFAYGEKPTRQSLQAVAADVADYMRDQLRDLGEQKPARGTLRQRIGQAVKSLPDHLRPRPKPSEENRPGVSGSGARRAAPDPEVS